MTIHPSLIENWQAAKKAAGHIAQAAGVRIRVKTTGEKGIELPSGNYLPCASWLALYEQVLRIRQDQISVKK